MPNCGCFHEFDLSSVGSNDYEIRLRIEGFADLKAALDETGLSESVSVKKGLFGTTIYARGVNDSSRLRGLLELVRSTIFVELAPHVDECYALGPYTLFDDDGERLSSVKGELLYQAKYRNNSTAASQLGSMLGEFIVTHPTLRNVEAVASPPKSDPNTPNLARLWCDSTAAMLGINTINVRKVRHTSPQKNVNEDDTEEDAVAGLAGSMVVDRVAPATRVLIVDDTIGLGATLREVGRAMREAGASHVYALAVTKNAKGTGGGVGLRREDWE